MTPAEFHIIRMPPDNTTSVLIESDGRAAIFDPWGRAADWEKLLRERGLVLHAIYATHGHFDHISAIPKLMQSRAIAEGGGGWHMHEADLPVIKWSNPILFMQGYGMIDLKKNPPLPISPGIMEILPGLNAEVIHLPGHSAGGVAFYIKFEERKSQSEGNDNFEFSTDNSPALCDLRSSNLLIVGDTLFQDCYGRTDLPTGDESQMRESLSLLRARNFPDDTVVIHGHGMDTTVGWLREFNPFFK